MNFLRNFFSPPALKPCHEKAAAQPQETVTFEVDTCTVMLIERASEGLMDRYYPFPPVKYYDRADELTGCLFLPDWHRNGQPSHGPQSHHSRVSIDDVAAATAALRTSFRANRLDDGTALVTITPAQHEALKLFCIVHGEFLTWKCANGEPVADSYIALFELASVQLEQAVAGKPPA